MELSKLAWLCAAVNVDGCHSLNNSQTDIEQASTVYIASFQAFPPSSFLSLSKPSHCRVFDHCKWLKTGQSEGLGARLLLHNFVFVYMQLLVMVSVSTPVTRWCDCGLVMVDWLQAAGSILGKAIWSIIVFTVYTKVTTASYMRSTIILEGYRWYLGIWISAMYQYSDSCFCLKPQ